jgi:hypothetical protein
MRDLQSLHTLIAFWFHPVSLGSLITLLKNLVFLVFYNIHIVCQINPKYVLIFSFLATTFKPSKSTNKFGGTIITTPNQQIRWSGVSDFPKHISKPSFRITPPRSRLLLVRVRLWSCQEKMITLVGVTLPNFTKNAQLIPGNASTLNKLLGRES